MIAHASSTMVIRLCFFSSQVLVLLAQIFIGCRDQAGILTAQRARTILALGIAHGNRVRREVIESRERFIHPRWFEALMPSCLMSV